MGQKKTMLSGFYKQGTPLAGILICLVLLGSAPKAETLRINHDNVERLVWVEDGRADLNNPAPLVLAIHGYRTPQQAAALRKDPARLVWPALQAVSHHHGAMVLYPAAFDGQWALFDGLRTAQKANGDPIDDEGFLLHLVAQQIAAGTADRDRIYITGISDGAIMTYRMICLPNTPFAAAGALIGTAFGKHLDTCAPKRPPALMHVHGTDDRVLPYDGWIFPSGREVSVPEVMEHWRRLHRCTAQDRQMLENIDPKDGSTVEEMTWTGCTRDGTVVRYKVIGGGHDVPDTRATERAPDQLRINRDLDTMGVMWAFFQANPRPE